MTKEQILKFLVAGRAVFTLVSRKTGEHFTYKFSKGRNEGVFFASVLAGADTYRYLGIYRDGCAPISALAAHVSANAPSLKALNWFLRHIDSPKVRFQHEGRCGRCGRPLTHPDSIDSGLGPECSGRGYAAPTLQERRANAAKVLARRHPRPVTPPSVPHPLRGFTRPVGPARPSCAVFGCAAAGKHLEGCAEGARLKAITCPKCHGKRDASGRCSDCGFGNDCCRALDDALDAKPEPNLVVPLLLSLNGETK